MPGAGDVARPVTLQDEELCERMITLQKAHPLFSETAICGLLEVGREYIANRAKKSQLVEDARSVMQAIRHGAWEQKGIELIDRPGQNTNPVVYIWMTRNMLGWRNDPVVIESHESEKKPVLTLSYSLKPKEGTPK